MSVVLFGFGHMQRSHSYMRVWTNKLSRWCIRARNRNDWLWPAKQQQQQQQQQSQPLWLMIVFIFFFFPIWPVWIHTDNRGHQDQGFRPRGVGAGPCNHNALGSLRTTGLISPQSSWDPGGLRRCGRQGKEGGVTRLSAAVGNGRICSRHVQWGYNDNNHVKARRDARFTVIGGQRLDH